MDSLEHPRRLTTGDVKSEARAAGFDLCGVAPAADFPELECSDSMARAGLCRRDALHAAHGGATRKRARRDAVREIRDFARRRLQHRSAVLQSERRSRDRAALARYAWGDDYHVVIEQRLRALVDRLRAIAGEDFDARTYVDTGPVQERVYAQYAGLGWIGKNTCLINEDLGSWIFLSEILCSLPLEPDAPGFDQCGTCVRCLEACPTGALVDPGVLDSTRCLSYLTIELKGSIPHELRDAVGEHAYGCDICQEVCPWNISPGIGRSDAPEWQPRDGLDGPRLLDLWNHSDDGLRALLKGSAMKRAGVKRLRRNLAVAIGNSGDSDAVAPLADCHEPTATDALVAEHVAWAIEKLGG